MSRKSTKTPDQTSDLAEFIRARHDQIIAEWEHEARELSSAEGLPKAQLQDAIPGLVERIADLVDEFAAGEAPRLPAKIAERHALDRLEDGYDLAEVITELSLLRECILKRWQTSADRPDKDAEQQRILRQAVDRTIIASTLKYTAARDRGLQALDRISSTTFESRSLDELLDPLAEAICETLPSVDTVVILLREDDLLYVRASCGLDEEFSSDTSDTSMRIGQGFAGKVAAEARPLQLSSAAQDQLVEQETFRSMGVEALYGVPLIDKDEVIGVVHVGSLTTNEFSEQDRAIFRSMAGRAAMAIRQHSLQAQTEERAEQLETAKRTLETLIDQMPVGVSVATPPDGQVVTHNEEAIRLLGHGILAPRSFDQFQHYGAHHPDGSRYTPEEYPTVRALFDGERIRGEQMHYTRGDGDKLIFELSSTPVRNSEGAIVAAVTTFWDISERKQSEEALERSEAQLREAYVQAQHAVDAREEILAVVSHDLRDPLATIDLSGAVLLSIDGIHDHQSARQQVEVIQRSSSRALRLISDLMDFSSIQTGRLKLDAEVAPLGPIIREAVESNKPLARENRVHLDYDLGLDGAQASVNHGRLLQVMSNLLGNALKFCEPADSIYVRAKRNEDTVEIAVADTGPGIAPDELEQLFVPYTKGHITKPGVGLGLSIVEGIIDAHGGRIWVESELGQGTTFFFTLPLVGDDAE